MDLDLRATVLGSILAFLLALGIFTGGRVAAERFVTSAFEVPIRY